MYVAQWKRNSILLVVKALVDTGVSPPEIRDFFKTLGRGNAFLCVEGESSTAEDFLEKANKAAAESGKIFHKRRWHLSDDDFMLYGGHTYILTNQWGRHWPHFMQAIKEKYPQIGLEYWPTGTDQ